MKLLLSLAIAAVAASITDGRVERNPDNADGVFFHRIAQRGKQLFKDFGLGRHESPIYDESIVASYAYTHRRG